MPEVPVWLGGWVPVAALIVASYAAIVATVNAYLNWRNNQRRLQVKLRYGYTMFSVSGRPLSDQQLIVDVRNRAGTAEVVNDHIVLAGSERIYRIDESTFETKTLVHGETTSFSVNPRTLANALRKDGHTGIRKIAAVVEERSERTFKSKAFTFDVDAQAAKYDEEQIHLKEQLREIGNNMKTLEPRIPNISGRPLWIPRKDDD